MKSKPERRIKSAWSNGLFYLLTFTIVITALGIVAGRVPLYTLAVVVIAGMLFILAVGALQLRQDDRLSEKSFLQLVRVVLSQLPIIGRTAKRGAKRNHPRHQTASSRDPSVAKQARNIRGDGRREKNSSRKWAGPAADKCESVLVAANLNFRGESTQVQIDLATVSAIPSLTRPLQRSPDAPAFIGSSNT